MDKMLNFVKRFKQEIGIIVAGTVGLLMAFGHITRDQWEIAGHLIVMTTGVALRMNVGSKGWKTFAGFIGMGINGILAGMDVLEPTQWLAIDGVLAAITGATLERAIRKANGSGDGSSPAP